MPRRPKLGLIAYDYLPVVGGMGTYARAVGLHAHQCGYEVHLFAGEKCRQDQPLQVHPILTADLARDLPRLRRWEMDLWHAVNFGYAPLACLKRPFVLTVHGTLTNLMPRGQMGGPGAVFDVMERGAFVRVLSLTPPPCSPGSPVTVNGRFLTTQSSGGQTFTNVIDAISMSCR